MSLRNIGIVYRKELREALRDRRTVVASVVVPLFLFPLLSVGFMSLVGDIVNKAKESSPKVMVVGGEDSPGVLAALKATPKVEVVPAASNWKDLVVDKTIPVAVEIPAGFDKSVADQKKLEVTIYNYSGELKSEIAAGKINDSLKAYRDDVIKGRVVAKNLSADVLDPFKVTQKNIAPPEKSGAALFFGGFIAYIVVFLCFNGGMHPSIDLTAGEKERGTMETILSSPISRAHLVVGKFLLVLTTALATAALSVISMGISFTIANVFQAQAAQAGKETMQMHIGVGAALSVFIMDSVGSLICCCPIDDCLLCKNLQRGADVPRPADFYCHHPRHCGDAARCRPQRKTFARPDSQRQFALQGIGHRHVPLEVHCHYLHFYLCIRFRRTFPCGQNVPA
jgi:sodium transport system permease protein